MSSIDTRIFGIPTEGLGFIAEYYTLPQWVSSISEVNFDLTPDAVEVVSELDIERSTEAFWDGGPQDSFAAKYSGALNVSQAGVYTFYLTSDDGSALYIDGQLVIDNDGNHGDRLIQTDIMLDAGSHDIEIRYFESGGLQTLKLEWEGLDTGGDRQLISSNVVDYSISDAAETSTEGFDEASSDADVAPQATESLGLFAKFFELQGGTSRLEQIDFNADPVSEMILSEVAFERGRDAWWDGGARNRFAAEITGQLNVETAGEYTIYLTSDDGSALFIDGEQVIDNDGLHGDVMIPVTLFLTAGSHDLELQYFENKGRQTLVLEWSGPDTQGGRTLIAGDSLSHSLPGSVTDDDGTDGSDTTGDTVDQVDQGGTDDGDPGHGDHVDTDGGDTGHDGGYDGTDGSDTTDDTVDQVDQGGTDDGDLGHGDHVDTDGGDTGQDGGNDGADGSDTTDDVVDNGDQGGTDDGDMVHDGGDHGTDGGDTGQDGGNDGTDGSDTTDDAVDQVDQGGTDDGDAGQGDQVDTDGGDMGHDGGHDSNDDQTSQNRGLVAQYFVLPTAAWSLAEIDFDATPDLTSTVSELNFENSNNPFWENGAQDEFAARYRGTLNVETAGSYTIYLTSDDGSAVYLNGERIIDNDGPHGAVTIPVVVDLEAGEHDLEVRYFEIWGDQVLRLEWSGPDTNGVTEVISGDSLGHSLPDGDTVHDGHDGTDGSDTTDDAVDQVDQGGTDDGDAGHGDHVDTDGGDTGQDGGNDGTDGSDTTDDAVDQVDQGGTDDGDAGQGDQVDTDGGDMGHDGGHDSNDDQTSQNRGLVAQYFVLPTAAWSLAEIDFDATPDLTSTVSELNFENSNNPFWENGAQDEFAARYRGTLNVETAGSYTIYLTSDDGSAVYLNGERIIDNDGPHGAVTIPVVVDLEAGEHDLEVRYFEIWGDQVLRLEWSGPDTNGVTEVISGDSLGHSLLDGDTVHDGHDGTDGTDTSDDAVDQVDQGGTDDGDAVHDGGDHGTDGSDTTDDVVDNGDQGGTDGGDMVHDGGDHGTDGSDTTDDMVDHGDHGGTDDGDMVHDGGDHGTDGSDTTDDVVDHGDHGGTDDGHTGHDDHADSDEVDHGGENLPGTIPEPTDPSEHDAFVAAVMAEPNAHAHGDNMTMSTEHGALLDLVDRSDATHVAVSDGDWFDPNTWYEGRIPDEGANVLIPKNIAVTYNGVSDASLFTVRVDGELSFATNINTRMVVDTMVVDTSGRLEIGTEDNPIAANVNAEIVIANNGDIDVSWDPTLLSRGVISHGQVEIHGAEKQAFLTVSEAPMRGENTLSLSEIPDGWQVGDNLVLTGTHQTGHTGTALGYIESQDEEITITAINGNQITFEPPLEHDHDTPRDDLFAYVANMSRNITFSSEDGDATQTHHRGHVMFMHNDDVDVRYAAFEDLGRTDKSTPAALSTADLGVVEPDSNIQGRYSFHFHLTGTSDQDNPAIAVGNTVDGSPGWGFVHHSSNANFAENVAFDVFGAAFVAEAGDETGSWFRNMAINAQGTNWGDWEVKDGARVSSQDTGHTGDGFFFAGRLVEAAENVAANTNNGFVWMMRNNKADPSVDNLDHPEIGYGRDTILNNLAPIQGFRDNEAFGTNTGIIVIKDFPWQTQHDLRTVFDGFLNWETSTGANLSYTSHYTFIDFDLINARERLGDVNNYGIDFGTNIYDMVLNGLRVEGFDAAVDFRSDFTASFPDSDVANILIDFESINNGTDILGYNPAAHQILTSDDLTPGRLEFVHDGGLSIALGENFSFDGVRTDSIGTRDRAFEQEPLQIEFYEHIIYLISENGYYRTEDGRNVLLIDDFITDRATGEVMKITHVVTLEMTDGELANNWMINNYANGARFNGMLDLGGSAPDAVDDNFSTGMNQGVLVDVLANDSDAESAELNVSGFTDPENGDVYVQEDGQLLYQPNINFEGTDTFEYWVADSSGQLSEATVVVEVWDL